jgi:hypothetical protein
MTRTRHCPKLGASTMSDMAVDTRASLEPETLTTGKVRGRFTTRSPAAMLGCTDARGPAVVVTVANLEPELDSPPTSLRILNSPASCAFYVGPVV